MAINSVASIHSMQRRRPVQPRVGKPTHQLVRGEEPGANLQCPERVRGSLVAVTVLSSPILPARALQQLDRDPVRVRQIDGEATFVETSSRPDRF